MGEFVEELVEVVYRDLDDKVDVRRCSCTPIVAGRPCARDRIVEAGPVEKRDYGLGELGKAKRLQRTLRPDWNRLRASSRSFVSDMPGCRSRIESIVIAVTVELKSTPRLTLAAPLIRRELRPTDLADDAFGMFLANLSISN